MLKPYKRFKLPVFFFLILHFSCIFGECSVNTMSGKVKYKLDDVLTFFSYFYYKIPN